MTDEKLRELERRWRESGTVEDEAAYLRERVRIGDLTQERVELAAGLGHAAAGSISSYNLGQLVSALLFGHEGEGADFAVTPEEEYREDFGVPTPEQWRFGVEAARRCFLALASREAARRFKSDLTVVNAVRYLECRLCGADPPVPHYRVIQELGEFQDEASGHEPQDADPALVTLLVLLQGGGGPDLEGFLCDFAHLRSDKSARLVAQALEADVLPWALGYGDPVRDRVEARQAAGG